MNIKTTVALLVLVSAAGLGLYFGIQPPPSLLGQPEISSQDFGSVRVLQQELAPENIKTIRIVKGKQEIILRRSADGEWTLPGRWPTRKPELDAFIQTLSHLRTRFGPIPLDDSTIARTRYGLEPPALTLFVTSDKEHQLDFGEDATHSQPFTRATFVRVDKLPEVVRLGTGLLASLDRNQDYFQQRRLFPSALVSSDGTDLGEKVERLSADSVQATSADGYYSLVQKDGEWVMQSPFVDQVDPDKARTLLTSIADVWAENFVPSKDLKDFGLDKPKESLKIMRSQGSPITLLVGNVSQVKKKQITRPGPNMGGMPSPPQIEMVNEEYRYAKLEGNDQVFEIKTDRFKDIFAKAETLRDPRLARFRTEDARSIEIVQGDNTIALSKDKDKWLVTKPYQSDADGSRATELLDRLASLQVTPADIKDNADLKALKLDPALARVTVNVEPPASGASASKDKKQKTYTFLIGKTEVEKQKLAVKLEAWPRVDLVDESLTKLVGQPALAYRNRRVLDFATADLARLQIQNGATKTVFEQKDGAWKFLEPVASDVDRSQVNQLADDLGKLEAVEYVTLAPKPEELDTKYGLSKPSTSALVSFTDAKTPAKTLLIGKARLDKPEFFAKLADSPGVFTIKKELHDLVSKDSLAYRPLALWQVNPSDINTIKIDKDGKSFSLTGDKNEWKITSPFESKVLPALVQPLVDELVAPRAEKYVAQAPKDLAVYGLAKPNLSVSFTTPSKPDPMDPKKTIAGESKTLLIGSQTEKDAKSRFAKLGSGDAVFTIGEKAVAAMDHSALDFLDPNLLQVSTIDLDKISFAGTKGPFQLERQMEGWAVVGSPAPKFIPDEQSLAELLGAVGLMRAVRYAAHAGKDSPLDLASFGLQPPDATVILGSKTGNHTLRLGKQADDKGDRYATLDNQPTVFVLAAEVADKLRSGYLDFVNRNALKLDAATITGLEITQGKETLELAKAADGWQIKKPVVLNADVPSIERLIDQIAPLRASKVVVYAAKDMKEFGFDPPYAQLRVISTGKPAEHIIQLGKKVGQDRLVRVDNGTTLYAVGDSPLESISSKPLAFRDRIVGRITDIDKLVQEQPGRKVVFQKQENTWKIASPVNADTEQFDLEDLLTLARTLRADSFVAEKPADLKLYGLDKPTTRWHFYKGDKEVLDLLVGAEEKPAKAGAPPRVYVKLAQGDLVFLLGATLSKRLTAEYRSRTVWPPLDAAQVERMTYGYRTAPFTLEKLGDKWQIAGKPDAKVDDAAVRELLDALGGLKAHRYAADQASSVKEFGLETPEFKVEIESRSGKRVLEIGRIEGDSNRVYARVGDGPKGTVFVLSEDDTRRIVRRFTK